MTPFRRYPFIAVLGVLLLSAWSATVTAQRPSDVRARLAAADSGQLQVITLADGSNIFGRVVGLEGDTVTFRTQAGSLRLAVGQIREIKEIAAGDVRAGEYWFPNPNSTRLFFAPTGQMLKQGEGYFSDYQLFFPGVAYGLTDNFTIGGGFSLIPAALEDQLYYVTPKIGFSVNDKVHLATGALIVGARGGAGGIYYGVGTLGDGNASLTIGGGYGFAGGEIESRPVGMIGGELRVARRIAFVTENYLLPISGNNVLYSFGLRFLGEKITTDLALVNVSGSEIIGIPYVDFVFRF